jgi:hypothetical protein
MYFIINLNKNYLIVRRFFAIIFFHVKTAYRSFVIMLHVIGIIAGLCISFTTHDPVMDKLIVSTLILLTLNLLRLSQQLL